MSRLYQRKKGGVWQMEFRIGDGPLIRKSTGETTKTAAEKVLKKALIAAEAEARGGRVTFDGAVKAFLTEYVDEHLKPRTQDDYRYYLARLRPWFAPYHLDEIDMKMLRACFNAYSAEHNKHLAHNAKRVLSSLFSFCVENDWMPTNLLLGRTLNLKPYKPHYQEIASEDLEAFLRACAPDLRAMVLFFLECQGRQSETFSLRVEDVSAEKQQVLFRAEITKNSKPRVAPVSRATIEAVLALPRPPGCPWLFPGKSGGRRTCMRCAVKNAARRAGIPHFRPHHGLRKAGAQLALGSGAPLDIVSHNLGHASIKTTEASYARHSDASGLRLLAITAPAYDALRTKTHTSPSNSSPPEESGDDKPR